MRRKSLWISSVLVAAACGPAAAPPAVPAQPAAPEPAAATAGPAIAVLQPTEGSKAKGRVTFEPVEGGVRIVGEFAGLAPGRHGFHVHQYGDCSKPDATSAGGHWNPAGAAHAGPDSPARHVGDLGNVEVGGDGTARYDRIDAVVALDGPNSIVGRGVILHADPDDLASQPTGNAGGRIACGVVGWKNPG